MYYMSLLLREGVLLFNSSAAEHRRASLLLSHRVKHGDCVLRRLLGIVARPSSYVAIGNMASKSPMRASWRGASAAVNHRETRGARRNDLGVRPRH